ncbi:anti-anti-sigma regulatory factor [Actinomadura cellulosilytica]|uniref:Anti-anti-sigma regulatory factor n=2 Tax=Thermomonosporaceae TaxID=2012 RepID=A0A7W3N0H2_9ACTN|nr:anti-anti-sigma regulatory factor [Thermomonospora cellulosilytica]
MHLDLSGVTSVDAGGAAVIAALATRLWPDGRLVLHRPPAGLCRILQVLWPELPGIEVRP